VLVTLSGTSTGTYTTDTSGNYSFTGLANGSYTVTPSKTGFTFTPANQPLTISGASAPNTNFTATAIPTWSISGVIGPLPAGSGVLVTLSGTSSGTATTDTSGNYSFSGLANGTYTLTPAKSGFTFTPVNKSVTVSNASVIGANFTATAP